MQRLFYRAVFLIPRPIKKRNQLLVWQPFDLLNPNQGCVTAEIPNLLGQSLEMFVLRRIIGQQIGRCFNLDGANLF